MADAIYGELLQASLQLCSHLSHDIHVYYSHHIDYNDAWTGIAKTGIFNPKTQIWADA